MQLFQPCALAQLLVLLPALCLTFFSGCSNVESSTPSQSSSSAQTVIEVKIATIGGAAHPATIAAQAFKEELEAMEADAFRVTLFPDGRFGGEQEICERVKINTVEMAVVSCDGPLSSWVPAAQLTAIPYLFNSPAQAHQLLDETVKPLLESKFAEGGYKNLAFFDLGMRHLASFGQPLDTLEALKGKTLLLPQSTLWSLFGQTLAFTPRLAPYHELRYLMERQEAEGFQASLGELESAGLGTLPTQIYLTGHSFGAATLIASSRWMESLPATQRDQLAQAAQRAAIRQRAAVQEQEEKLLHAFQERDVLVKPADAKSLQETLATFYRHEQLTALVDPTLVETLLAKQKEIRYR